jgi:beta-lactamase class A
VPALPAPFAAPISDDGLRETIEGVLSGREGRFSIIAHNLADGRSALINEGEVYYAASLFKTAVLLDAYRQRDAGTVDFSEELVVDEELAQYDLGTLEYLELEPGDLVTLGDAVKAMIVVSDTVLANVALERLGYHEVDGTLDSVGAETMTVTDRALPTTASDMAALVLAIARGDGVSDASRLEMLSFMTQEWFRQGIFAGIPAGTVAAHKTGSFDGATHDVAIVWGPAGPYLLAILTDRSYEWEPIAAVSDAVWRYFESNP